MKIFKLSMIVILTIVVLNKPYQIYLLYDDLVTIELPVELIKWSNQEISTVYDGLNAPDYVFSDKTQHTKLVIYNNYLSTDFLSHETVHDLKRREILGSTEMDLIKDYGNINNKGRLFGMIKYIDYRNNHMNVLYMHTELDGKRLTIRFDSLEDEQEKWLPFEMTLLNVVNIKD